jgi:hypothetical protein
MLVELPTYTQALKDAGLDTLQTELESQYALWKEAKGE